MRNKILRKKTFKKYGTYLGQIAESEPTIRTKTGIRGVYKTGGPGRYQARITVNKKEIYLGSSTSLDDAIAMRKNAEKEYYEPIIKDAIKAGDFMPNKKEDLEYYFNT